MSFTDKLEPADVIAVVALVGGLYLKLHGADGVVGSIMVGITAYYFGKSRRVSTTSDVQP